MKRIEKAEQTNVKRAAQKTFTAAERISKSYDYDQVIIIARKVGQGEHVTTYGRDKQNCQVAAQCGNFLKYKVMNWVEESEKP